MKSGPRCAEIAPTAESVPQHTTNEATRQAWRGHNRYSDRITRVDGHTRMGMHQAMMEEVTHLGNDERPGLTWQGSNLLAGGANALDRLFGLYRRFHDLASPPSGAYEGTSLMRPCNGSKRVPEVPKGWAGG